MGRNYLDQFNRHLSAGERMSSLPKKAAGAFQTYHYYIFDFSAPGDSKLFSLLCIKSGTAGFDAILGGAVRPGQNIGQRHLPGLGRDRHGQTGDSGLCRWVNKSYDQALQEQMSMVPLQKMSQPEEVANLVYFLLGEDQTSFTGQTFDINNGALMPS